MLTLAPTVDLAIFATKETMITSTGNMANSAHRDVFDEDRRVFKSHWVVDPELAVFISSHSVKIIIVSHETGVGTAASYLANGNVIRAELGGGIHLVSSQANTQSELSFKVSSP